MGNPYAPPGESPRDRGEAPGQGWPDPAAPPAGPAGTRTDGDGPAPGAPRSPGAGGRPPGAPTPGPDRPPPTPEEIEATRVASRRALRFYAFLIAGLVTLPLPLPWQAASLLFVLGAIGVGVHGFVQAWRGGVRGATLAALGVMTGVAGLVALMVLSLLAVWPEQLDRQRCLAGAVTISATRACEVEFEQSIQERLGGMGGAPGSTGG